jgi:hypothetical protein
LYLFLIVEKKMAAALRNFVGNDPIMKGLTYGVGTYVVGSLAYSVSGAGKAKPKHDDHGHHQEQHSTPVAATQQQHHESHHDAALIIAVPHSSSSSIPATSVIGQLNTISERLTRIEKALGI